jgi:hypothetical protein
MKDFYEKHLYVFNLVSFLQSVIAFDSSKANYDAFRRLTMMILLLMNSAEHYLLINDIFGKSEREDLVTKNDKCLSLAKPSRRKSAY